MPEVCTTDSVVVPAGTRTSLRLHRTASTIHLQRQRVVRHPAAKPSAARLGFVACVLGARMRQGARVVRPQMWPQAALNPALVQAPTTHSLTDGGSGGTVPGSC
eukprot:4473379-Amphidinium_carterae.1